jgi:hypothetical protein
VSISDSEQLQTVAIANQGDSLMAAAISATSAVTAALPFQGEWQPLASVSVVFRVFPAPASLRHVVESVDAFLDATASFSVGSAARFASVRLLARVAVRDGVFISNDYRRKQFEDAMTQITEHGSVDVVLWLTKTYCPWGRVSTEVVAALAANGHLNALMWLFDNHDNVYWGGDEMHFAVVNNRLDVAKWLQVHTMPPTEDALLLDEAAHHGDLEMMRWLHAERGEKVSYDGTMRAVNNGFLDAVKWLCQTFDFLEARDLVMDKTAGNGHLEMVKWLHSQSAWSTCQAMNRAARNGHLPVVKWLHEHRGEGCSTDAMDYAAANGHLEVVQWLHVNRSEGCTAFAMDAAAKNGFLSVVEWLHFNRSEGCTKRAMDDAAANGHMDVLQWLYEHRTEGCSVAAVEGATQYSHWVVVEWLHQAFPGQFVPEL